jgi:hypothetical protein
MANRPSSSRPSSRPPAGRGGAQAGGRRRTPPPPVKKPFPWGVAAVSTVLGLLLAGILAYAVTNQGAGFIDPLKAADNKVPGVLKYKEARDHVAGTVSYPQSPPAGGKHNSVPQTCQVYTSAIANEHAVHSLEHGAVWITYRPDTSAAQVSELATKVTGNSYRMLSPYPGLKSAISLQAWGRQIFVNSASDSKVDKFLNAYTQGPQAPENGVCQGNTTTGPLQVAPAATATVNPSPAASAAASPAASPSPK